MQIVSIEKVVYNDPATVVFWSDKTKTVVKCQEGDKYDPQMGFLMAVCKKVCGNTGMYNELIREWVPTQGKTKNIVVHAKSEQVSIAEMRRRLKNYCQLRRCTGCVLSGESFDCGRGYMFDLPKSDSGYMDEDMIRRHYEAFMKGSRTNG